MINEIKKAIKSSDCLMADIWFKELITVNKESTKFIEVESIELDEKKVFCTLGNTKQEIVFKQSFFEEMFDSTNSTIPI